MQLQAAFCVRLCLEQGLTVAGKSFKRAAGRDSHLFQLLVDLIQVFKVSN